MRSVAPLHWHWHWHGVAAAMPSELHTPSKTGTRQAASVMVHERAVATDAGGLHQFEAIWADRGRDRAGAGQPTVTAPQDSRLAVGQADR